MDNVATISLILSSSALLLTLFLLWQTSRLTRHYNSLVEGVSKKSLMQVLEGIQKTLSSHERNLVSLQRDFKDHQLTNQKNLQHLTLKRFNPFSDTGGDQSFMLALLDGEQNGVIITSLHSRENTRFYVKSIKNGKGDGHPLSKDEQNIIKNKS